MSQTIRVLLVEDHKLTGTAVRSLLSSVADILLLDEIVSTTKLLQLCAKYEPDILLISLNLFGEAQKQLTTLTNSPVPNIVLLAADCTDVYASELREKNILGCILREQIPDELIPTIRSVIAGVVCYSEPIAQKLVVQDDMLLSTNELDKLTDREKEVLSLLTDGLTNREISLQLQIAESTIEFHMGNLFKKLNVASRVEAAVWATKHNFD